MSVVGGDGRLGLTVSDGASYTAIDIIFFGEV